MPRRTSLVLKNLTYQWSRTLVSIGGLMLAIVLMFMQLGFLGAVEDTAVSLYDKMQMDLLVRSQDYLHLFEAGSIDNEVIRSVGELEVVANVSPLNTVLGGYRKIVFQSLSNTSSANDASIARVRIGTAARGIAILGIDTNNIPIQALDLAENASELATPNDMLIDRKSRADFGPVDGKRFGSADIGVKAEVNGARMQIVETFEMGTGLAATGAVAVNRHGFDLLTGGVQRGRTSLVLVQLKPEANIAVAQEELREHLRQQGYHSINVLTKAQAKVLEKKRWAEETPVGIIFRLGSLLAAVVGVVICYMVLASDVMAKLPEYATLKAIGYSNWYLARVLVNQAITLAICSFIPAVILSLVLYSMTSVIAGVPITMTLSRLIIVAIASVGMCMIAGLAAIQKLAKAEPASLF